jgi:hypothetical protein
MAELMYDLYIANIRSSVIMAGLFLSAIADYAYPQLGNNGDAKTANCV